MITNEMKARVFYLYPFAKIMYADTLYRLKSIDVDWDKMEIAAVGSGVVDTVRISGSAQLLLTPLSEITDEDIDGCWIAGGGNDGYYDKRGSVETLDFSGFTTTEILQMTDFLRSRGYALPYMGIDLFESGIAIPNNKMK